ncbi:MAG: hypothetical protein JWM41_1008 [Gemmatimonadetes bacterium]|nr:hypothetical protein [Gemmatimonadota bacterium]
MYATVRRYTGNAGANKNLATRVEGEFIPILRTIPGFVSYTVIDAEPENGRDVLMTVSIYTTREGADASVSAAAKWVGENFKDLGLSQPQITAGNVIVNAGVQTRAEVAYTQ